MIQIRQGVFETNSSSTHALAICTQEEWDKLQSGEYVVDAWDITKMFDANDEAVKDDVYEIYCTYDELYDRRPFEFFTRHFTSPSGDKMVAWGFYGYEC
jgi:hypothetical protein